MKNIKEYKLHPPSEEQTAIILDLANKNVWVQAVAGSGKTTTTLHIAQRFTEKKILLLTYNKKLSFETEEKIKLLNLTNLEVYTFHAFSAKTWQVNCQTDDGLIEIINNDLKPVRDLKYDLIIIDEAQDITPIYYEILCKLISSNINKVTLCVLGDKNQSIYSFNDADPRYLVFANEVFNLNNLSWQHCKLSQSFRVNKPMATFINEVFYDEKIMYSNINNDDKNDYIVTDTFNSPQLVKEILKLIENYGKDNVFLLAPSIKKDTSPAKKISNKLSDEGILIYAPTNDDEKLDPEEMVNKLCLSTFHQAKGLERKAVVVFGFDIGYFKYNARDDDPLLPHNALYVAISRALEKLIIVHHIKNEPLPFLNKEKIKATTNFKFFGNNYELNKFNSLFNKKFDGLDEFNNPDVGVTNVLKYLPSAIVSFCKKNIEMIEVKDNESENTSKKLFNIPSKLKLEKNGEKYQENVSTITGTSTILNYQRVTTKTSSPLTFLLNEIENNYDKTKEEVPNLLNHTLFLKNLDKKDDWTINETLFLAALWNYFMDRYNFKLNQIPNENYDWVKSEDFEKINNLIKSKISSGVWFEVRIEKSGVPELFDKRLIGFIDCIDIENNIVWEFKFVDKVTQEHFLQLALYAYLISNHDDYKHQNFKYFIYNIKKNQTFELKVKDNDLIEIVKSIFHHKYGKKIKISDKQFLEKALKIMNKYKKIE